MDRETATNLVTALGGYVTSAGGGVSICGLSGQAQEIADLLDLDFERIDLDKRIDHFIRDPFIPDEKVQGLMRKSESWHMVESPTLDIEAAVAIEEALWDRPGAVVLRKTNGEWELWVKLGPEFPVYLAAGNKHDTRAQSPDTKPKSPLFAILVRDSASEYIGWDFGSFDGTNWNTFAHGLITGLTCEVIKVVELPDNNNGGVNEAPDDGT